MCLRRGDLYRYMGGGGHRAENIDRQSDGQQRQEILTDAK